LFFLWPGDFWMEGRGGGQSGACFKHTNVKCKILVACFISDVWSVSVSVFKYDHSVMHLTVGSCFW
jgi:hypothetical protein